MNEEKYGKYCHNLHKNAKDDYEFKNAIIRVAAQFLYEKGSAELATKILNDNASLRGLPFIEN